MQSQAVKDQVFTVKDNLESPITRDVSQYEAWHGLWEELQIARGYVSKVR